jgi:hypothetical protein
MIQLRAIGPDLACMDRRDTFDQRFQRICPAIHPFCTRPKCVGHKVSMIRQLGYEKWRLLASLEHLIRGTRALLGNELLPKLKKEPENAIWLWSLARLGARIPLYGPLHCVVAPEVAGEWVTVLLDLPTFTAVTASAIALIARRTDDRVRDIDEEIRERAVGRLSALGTSEAVTQVLTKYVPPERTDAAHMFGEPLPPGLKLVASPNCLLSLPAFHTSDWKPPKSACCL